RIAESVPFVCNSRMTFAVRSVRTAIGSNLFQTMVWADAETASSSERKANRSCTEAMIAMEGYLPRQRHWNWTISPVSLTRHDPMASPFPEVSPRSPLATFFAPLTRRVAAGCTSPRKLPNLRDTPCVILPDPRSPAGLRHDRDPDRSE